jgi:hypothetical protein
VSFDFDGGTERISYNDHLALLPRVGVGDSAPCLIVYAANNYVVYWIQLRGANKSREQ